MTKTRTAKIVSRITTWILRIMVLLTILFFVAVIVTATMGGKGDIQRQSLETVAGNALGMSSTIHDLRMYRIFPQFYVDLSNFEARRAGDDLPALIIERVLFAQDLWPRLWGAPAISAVEFDNLVTRPGVLGPYSLHLTEGRIKDSEKGLSSFQMSGTYAGLPVTVQIPLGHNNDYVRIDGLAPVQVTVGDVVATFIVQIQKDVIVLSSFQVEYKGGRVQGTIILPRVATQDVPLPLVQVMDDATGARRVYNVQSFGQDVVFAAQGGDGNNAVKSPTIEQLGAYFMRVFRTTHPIDEHGKNMAYPKIQVK